MIKKLFLTYYYVWFQAHKRSKYAHQFSLHWYQSFLQVCLTVGMLVLGCFIFLDKLLEVNLKIGKLTFLALFILVSSFVYYLLFVRYNANKESDETNQFGIIITKCTRLIAWSVFLLSFIIPMLMIVFWK